MSSKGGMEGAEVIMWLIMRGALSDHVTLKHKTTYAPSVTNIATMILEDEAPPRPRPRAGHREHMGYHLAGAEKVEGHPSHSPCALAGGVPHQQLPCDLIKPEHAGGSNPTSTRWPLNGG
ncbi:MAG: hypothetical protein R3D80_05660 [Paracoccaceae bacterium]